MSTTERSGSEPRAPAGVRAAPAGPGEGEGGVSHPRSFKLRFAARRVPGHSYMSAVRPLTLPALVTDKWWARGAGAGAGAGAGEQGGAAAGERGGAGAGAGEQGGAAAGERGGAAAERALRRVEDLFARGPRDKYERPLLSSHEYGWWAGCAAELWAAPRGDRRLQHGLRDSAWLKARLRVLAEDAPAAPRRR